MAALGAIVSRHLVGSQASTTITPGFPLSAQLGPVVRCDCLGGSGGGTGTTQQVGGGITIR